MDTATRPDLGTFKATAQKDAQEGCDYLLKTFSFVKDENLNWVPSESARSALQMVVHCANANHAFASIVRGDEVNLPPEALADFRKFQRDMEAAVTDRDTAVQMLNDTTREVIDAIGTVDEEAFATSPSSPFGPMPMAFWMTLSGMHMKAHACQIDYLQTIWGDLEDHF